MPDPHRDLLVDRPVVTDIGIILFWTGDKYALGNPQIDKSAIVLGILKSDDKRAQVSCPFGSKRYEHDIFQLTGIACLNPLGKIGWIKEYIVSLVGKSQLILGPESAQTPADGADCLVGVIP